MFNDIFINIQGDHWKEILSSKEESEDTLYLPLQIYFDDFEPNNPCGGHAIIHKLTGCYVKLLCLPPHLASKLWSVIVAMIFHSEDRKEFDNKLVLKSLIKMLTDLETVGISLETPIGNTTKIKIVSCLVVGDNLGLQQILDFTVGFNSHFACRICIVLKTRRKTMTIEDERLIRKIEQYDLHCENRLYGVQAKTVFHNLPSFHIYKNLYADIMHDLLEGICHYVFSKVFHIFIHQKARFNFKITDLNYRILTHNFGPDTHAKPLLIANDYMNQVQYKFQKLKYTASEMLTFTRHIPMLLFGLIPSDCEEMLLLKKLRRLISLFFNHGIQIGALPYMSIEIEGFLKSYLRICGHLTPKFHYMLHYPRIIKAVGPLLNIACFGFEAMHQPLKRTARSSNNQINLPVTLHKKVEAKFCISLINSEELLKDTTYLENKKAISGDLCKLHNLRAPVSNISHLYFKGLRIQKSSVLQLGIDENNFPELALVKMMVKDVVGLKLIVEDLEVFNFDTDVCAYEVMYTNNFYAVNLDSLSVQNTFVSCVSKVSTSFFVNWI